MIKLTKKLRTEDIKIKLPDLKNIQESKAVTIGKWLISWIEQDKSVINGILPSKSDFAYMLGVSTGTMQNAIRYIEDLGYVESKQCIGTIVKDKNSEKNTFRKLTSKKDLAEDAIKRYILSDGFKVGSQLPSTKTISTIIGFSANTTRLALETLSAQNIISHKFKNCNEIGWILNSIDFKIKNIAGNNTKTLVNKIVSELENYISENLKIGDSVPSHEVLAKNFNTSIKTIHDALKVLSQNGIILPRRGRYGTTVINIPNSTQHVQKPESSIFASAKDTAFYHYEKTQNLIKRIIAEEYEIGEKLPSIIEMSEKLDLSPNTIRKAFHNLAKEGYLVFSRGRYGGTFVIDIPEIESQSFKWIAVNPQFAKEFQEN